MNTGIVILAIIVIEVNSHNNGNDSDSSIDSSTVLISAWFCTWMFTLIKCGCHSFC